VAGSRFDPVTAESAIAKQMRDDLASSYSTGRRLFEPYFTEDTMVII
jgi:hypothetical protein